MLRSCFRVDAHQAGTSSRNVKPEHVRCNIVTESLESASSVLGYTRRAFSAGPRFTAAPRLTLQVSLYLSGIPCLRFSWAPLSLSWGSVSNTHTHAQRRLQGLLFNCNPELLQFFFVFFAEQRKSACTQIAVHGLRAT
jgi:hypothetical protein